MKEEKLTKINLFINILPLLLLLLYIIGGLSSFALYVYSAILLIILLPLFIIFSSICLLICKKNYARTKSYIINSVLLILQIVTSMVFVLN